MHARQRKPPGDAELRTLGLVRRYAVTLRVVAGVASSAVVLLAVPLSGARAAECAVLIGWSIFRLPTRSRRAHWLLYADLALVLAVDLAQPFTEGSVALTGTYVLGASWVSGVGPPWTVTFLILLPVAALLSRALYESVVRAARRADAESAKRTATVVSLEVAASRRTAEREHWAVVHDTAASTLLMIGNGVPPETHHLVRRQARRDLDTLATDRPLRNAASEGDVELATALQRLATDSVLSVELVTPRPFRVPPEVARAITGAVEELLTNIARHAGVRQARIDAHEAPDLVELVVSDQGIGFADGHAYGRGLRESVIGRMDRIDGSATITGAPGRGTTATLHWAATASTPPEPALTAAAVLRGYRWGIAIIATGFTTNNFLNGAARSALPLWVDVLCLCGLYLISARAVMHLLRRTDWGWDSYVLAVLGLGVAALGAFALPGNDLLTIRNWTLGAVGWPLVVCLLDRGFKIATTAVAANFGIVLAALYVAGRWDDTSLASFTNLTIGLATLMIAGAAFAIPLRHAAEESEQEAEARTRLLAEDTVAVRLQADSQHRYDALRHTAIPLLRRLAQGSADPADVQVRRQARVEASRMRRLFAEAEPADDPLLHAIRASVEEVERAGVAISLDYPESCPPMPAQLRRALLDQPMATLSCAGSRARVVVTAEGVQVSVSVVTDGPAPSGEWAEHDFVQVHTTRTEEQTWTYATCNAVNPP